MADTSSNVSSGLNVHHSEPNVAQSDPKHSCTSPSVDSVNAPGVLPDGVSPSGVSADVGTPSNTVGLSPAAGSLGVMRQSNGDMSAVSVDETPRGGHAADTAHGQMSSRISTLGSFADTSPGHKPSAASKNDICIDMNGSFGEMEVQSADAASPPRSHSDIPAISPVLLHDDLAAPAGVTLPYGDEKPTQQVFTMCELLDDIGAASWCDSSSEQDDDDEEESVASPHAVSFQCGNGTAAGPNSSCLTDSAVSFHRKKSIGPDGAPLPMIYL